MTLHDDLDDDDLDGGLPPHLRRMLHDGADGPPLPAAVSDRLLGRVLVSVGAAAATTAAATSVVSSTSATTATATTSSVVTTSAATAATGIGLGLKAAIVAGVVGVAAIVGVVVVGPPSSPMRAIEVPVAPAPPVVPGGAVAPVVPVERVEPLKRVEPVAPAPAASTTVPSPPPKPVVVSPVVVAPAAWELPLLEQARGALAAGRTDEALALVDDHQRRAPASALLEESTALRVIALSRAGRVDEAKVAASSFVQRWPKSLFGERVRQVLR